MPQTARTRTKETAHKGGRRSIRGIARHRDMVPDPVLELLRRLELNQIRSSEASIIVRSRGESGLIVCHWPPLRPRQRGLHSSLSAPLDSGASNLPEAWPMRYLPVLLLGAAAACPLTAAQP